MVARMYVARFRLRFLLQELDLIGPLVTLGRSSDCQITLDDPLVSRVHAQLTVTDSHVRVRDLGSRNGVRVNGELIAGEADLHHNDRLRLGSQDLVFLAVEGGAEHFRMPRATGSMEHCQRCERPFPGESPSCPHCGAPASGFAKGNGPDTVTGVELGDAPSWTFKLISEVIERALVAGRVPEAERMLERAARDIDDRLGQGRRIGRDQVIEASRFALRLAKAKLRPEWAQWAIELHRREKMVPTSDALDLLESLDENSFVAIKPLLEALLHARRDRSKTTGGLEDEATEHRIAALLQRATG